MYIEITTNKAIKLNKNTIPAGTKLLVYNGTSSYKQEIFSINDFEKSNFTFPEQPKEQVYIKLRCIKHIKPTEFLPYPGGTPEEFDIKEGTEIRYFSKAHIILYENKFFDIIKWLDCFEIIKQ